MKQRFFALEVILLFTIWLFPQPAHADGIIIPDPIICGPELCPPDRPPIQQLIIRYHHVTVTIQD